MLYTVIIWTEAQEKSPCLDHMHPRQASIVVTKQHDHISHIEWWTKNV